MKEKILKLRNEGKTYKEISELLNIKKGMVEYYCSPNRKNFTTISNYNWRKRNRLYKKVSAFHYISKNRCKESFTYKQFQEKIGDSPACYITKTPINLEDIQSYSIDHIIPNSKGGTNDISNAGLIRMDINKMKQNKTLEEFLELCKEVLESNGYKVEKIIK